MPACCVHNHCASTLASTAFFFPFVRVQQVSEELRNSVPTHVRKRRRSTATAEPRLRGTSGNTKRRRAGTLQGSAGTEYAAAPAAPGAAAAGGADANHLPSLGQSHADGHNGTIGACQSGLQAQHLPAAAYACGEPNLPTVSSKYAPPDPAFAAEEAGRNLNIDELLLDSYEEQNNILPSMPQDCAPVHSRPPAGNEPHLVPPYPASAAEEVAKNLDIDSYEDQRNSMLSIALDDAPIDSTHPENDVWRELDWS